MNARADDRRWQRRATRARRLAGERPAVTEALFFYADLVELQETLLHRYPHVSAIPSTVFADRLNPGAALEALPELLAFIKRQAPASLAGELGAPGEDDLDRWRHRIHTYWITGGREAWDSGPIERFILEALLGPFAEVASHELPRPSRVSDEPNMPEARCETCTGLPVAALLREQAHGSKRSLVCGFCLCEWSSPRLACLHCGETTFQSLPVFRSDEFDAVRVDACESCKTYVKTVDLTRDGDASPVVDDIASLPLDVWAREKGYRRLRPNLLGF